MGCKMRDMDWKNMCKRIYQRLSKFMNEEQDIESQARLEWQKKIEKRKEIEMQIEMQREIQREIKKQKMIEKYKEKGKMKVLIVSDSHGRNLHMNHIMEKEKDIDLMIHLGDLEGTEDYLEDIAPYPVYMVAGNNDYFSQIDREKIVDIGPYKAFITHGNRYGVYSGTETIKEVGKELGVDMVMFGHTHIPIIDDSTDVLAINPGSISYPRQEDKIPTYAIMNIDEEGGIECSIYRVSE